MNDFSRFAKAIRSFNEQLANIATQYQTLEAQRSEVAKLIRNESVIGSPDVIADLLAGKKMRADLRRDDQDMWVAFELLRQDGIGYDDALRKVADGFFKSTKTVEAAISKAKKTGRFISPSIFDEKNR